MSHQRKHDFRVCVATDRRDGNGNPVWRACGFADWIGNTGAIDVTADTVFGSVAMVLHPTPGPRREKQPDMTVYVDTGRKQHDNTPELFEAGVAYANRRGGYNVLADSPAGPVRLFLFPAERVEQKEAA
jgi:hypothetical protein